jgi:putative acetyltransferase
MQVRTGDTFDPRVIELLDHHVTAARAQTAPGSAHALDLAGLRASDVAFWTGWDGETLVATGVLKMLSADHGEVKSMHTLQTTRRRGFGGQMLRHIIAEPARVARSGSASRPAPGIISSPRMRSTRRTVLCSAARSRAMSRIPTACS